MRVLLVDDSAVMRDLMARSLGSAEAGDVEVVEAGDGMQALAAIAHHGQSIDLILCDMNISNVNGLSILRSLRRSPELRHIPFVVVSADESDETMSLALREGAAGVIGKPFRLEDMAAIVRKKCSHGKRTTSGIFKTEAVTRMLLTISRSGHDIEQKQ